jgi:hypothetical protein
MAAREAKQNDENKEDCAIVKRVTAASGAGLKGDAVSSIPAQPGRMEPGAHGLQLSK